MLNLRRADREADGQVPFGHNNPCPAYVQPLRQPSAALVKVGIAVLAEDAQGICCNQPARTHPCTCTDANRTHIEGRCLLTRRSAHLRSFPDAWVLPGGGVDAGESLLDTGARELREETGLEAERASMRVMGVWESTFPHVADGARDISHHHVVVYVSARVIDASTLALQASEVQACAFLTRAHASALVCGGGGGDGGGDDGPPLTALLPAPRTAGASWSEAVAVSASAEVRLADMRAEVTYGTLFALKLWLGGGDDDSGGMRRAVSL